MPLSVRDARSLEVTDGTPSPILPLSYGFRLSREEPPPPYVFVTHITQSGFVYKPLLPTRTQSAISTLDPASGALSNISVLPPAALPSVPSAPFTRFCDSYRLSPKSLLAGIPHPTGTHVPSTATGPQYYPVALRYIVHLPPSPRCMTPLHF